jgi:hypothetical protein
MMIKRQSILKLAAVATSVLCAIVASPPTHATEGFQAERIGKTEVIGTAFQVTLTNGKVLTGKELVGATLSLLMPSDAAVHRVRLDDIVTDARDPEGEVLLYKVAVLDGGTTTELCDMDPDGNRWMFPLEGQWDAEGRMISRSGFTLTCSAGAQGKCVRFGYKPWKTLTDGTDLAVYHSTCVKMVRADYCGDQATTRTGMKIDLYDNLGIQREAESSGKDELSFEAAWGTGGAVCVAHTRVPEKMTLKGLESTCPRLADRLGSSCTDENARLGRFGQALIFNRSH